MSIAFPASAVNKPGAMTGRLLLPTSVPPQPPHHLCLHPVISLLPSCLAAPRQAQPYLADMSLCLTTDLTRGICHSTPSLLFCLGRFKHQIQGESQVRLQFFPALWPVLTILPQFLTCLPSLPPPIHSFCISLLPLTFHNPMPDLCPISWPDMSTCLTGPGSVSRSWRRPGIKC